MKMNPKTVVSSILCACFIASCSPTEQQIQTAIAQTQSAMPTATLVPTVTPVPFTGADLEALLLQPGDLPTRFEAQQFFIDPPSHWGSPSLYRGVVVIADGYVGDGVAIGVYDTPVDDDTFFAMGGQSGETVEGLGDASGLVSGGGEYSLGTTTLVWRHCNYVGIIDLFAYVKDSDVVTYAKRLDARLAEVLCP